MDDRSHLSSSVRFVSGDWGSTYLRLRIVDGDVREEIRESCGSLELARASNREQAYSSALAECLKKLPATDDLPILLSGTASSSIGWKELPYAKLPFAMDGRDLVWQMIADRVYLISGVRNDTDIDVMRGEETQVMGLVAFLGSSMSADTIFVLPGTHSKHIRVVDGSIVSFRTHMTGELFSLLCDSSILRYSTEWPALPFELPAFLEGVEESKRQDFLSGLFRVRGRDLLKKEKKTSNSWFLSGLMIGSELLSLQATTADIVIAAQTSILTPYVAAAEALGLQGRLTKVDSDFLAVWGQCVVLERILSEKSSTT